MTCEVNTSAGPAHTSWWAAVAATAAAYGYFLIFAEFAFLELARKVAREPATMRLIMLGLGAGGVVGAVLAARWFRPERGRLQLAAGFVACAVTAGLALAAGHVASALVVAMGVGASLGSLTVTLAAMLRRVAGGRRLGLAIGLGTGLAYGGCNLPWVFEAAPETQTVGAALLALAAAFVPRLMTLQPVTTDVAPPYYDRAGVVRWLFALLAVVWMDSAAFFVIQHAPALRGATWGDSTALELNAGIHLVAAVGAGALLDRGARSMLTRVATALLAVACLMLNGTLPSWVPAVWWYAAGVSFYSTVLVEYPARSGRAGLAALIFAVAGWVGSALGIGMAQDLQGIPVAFVVVAGAIVLAMLGWPRRVRGTLVLAAFAAGVPAAGDLRAAEGDPQVARGREVYVAEGCIHCHSQYVRPRVATDVEWWGPAAPLREVLAAAPPLPGNRRQGPDLANVGNRRSVEWNRLHLQAPRQVSPGSRMPSYAHLFSPGDDRGDALVAYLASLGAETLDWRRAQAAAWRPPERLAVTSPPESRRLFQRLCTPCHGREGRGDGELAPRLAVRPPDWATTPWRHVRTEEGLELGLGRIIKYGLPGLPMAGHEYLPDRDVVGLARFVQTLHPAPGRASLAVNPP